jgi:hypothetical protein
VRYCEKVAEPSLRRLMLKRINRYLAVSTANQFVWNLLRNRSRVQLFGWLPRMLGRLYRYPRLLGQVLACLVVPRPYILKRVLNRARLDRSSRLKRFAPVMSGRPLPSVPDQT